MIEIKSFLCFSVTKCGGPGDVAFALDGSDSITDTDFRRMINFTLQNIDSFELAQDKIRVGANVYSNTVTDYFTMSFSESFIKSRISSFIQPRDGTNTHLAIENLRNYILKTSRTRVGVIITDGVSKEPSMTLDQANKAKNEGIVLVAVGIGIDTIVGITELNNIANNPSLVKIIDSFSSLESITTIAELRELLCKGKIKFFSS